MYEQGRGVAQDFVESHMWYNLASSRGDIENQKTCAIARDQVARKMTSEQIAEAQRRAREWGQSAAK